MTVFIVWNGQRGEDGAIVEIFDNEQAAKVFVNSGEAERQGHLGLDVDDDIEAWAVYETVAESHDSYIELLRGRMIQKMSADEREAMGVSWGDELNVKVVVGRTES